MRAGPSEVDFRFHLLPVRSFEPEVKYLQLRAGLRFRRGGVAFDFVEAHWVNLIVIARDHLLYRKH